MFFWAFLEKNTPFLLGFAFSIILARLISPEAYGLLAMTGIFMAIGGVLQNMGFGAALIQREGVTETEVTSVFVANVTLGALMSLALVTISPQIANFYGRQELISVLVASAALLFIASAGLVQSTILQREFKFRVGLVVETSSTFFGGLVGLGLAWYGLDLWALLALALVKESSRTVLLWALVRWRPSGTFSLNALRSLWPYSRDMLAASVYHHFATNLSSVLIGKFQSATALGLFTRAQSLQNLPLSLVSGPLQRVAFPLYCREQHDRAALLVRIRVHTRQLALIAAFLTVIMVANAREIVLILIGEAWLGSVTPLRILSTAIFLSMLSSLHSEMNKALGESRYFLWIEVAKKTVLIMLVLVGSIAGALGIAVAMAIASATDYALSSVATRRFIGYRWLLQARDAIPAVVTMVPALLGAALVARHSIGMTEPITLVFKATIITTVFLASLAILGSSTYPDAYRLLRRGAARVAAALGPK